MSSAEEIIKTIKDYYKDKPIKPTIALELGYWCGDGFYKPETHSLHFYCESEHIGEPKKIGVEETIELPLTSLEISLSYGEEVGDVVFRIPPRRGGRMMIQVFNIAPEHENRIKEELLEICELLNFKPDPEDLFLGRKPKTI